MSVFETIARYGPGSTTAERDILFSMHESFRLLEAERPSATVERAQLGGIAVGRVTSTGHEVRLREDASFSFLVPIRGGMEVETDRSALSALPRRMLAFSPGRRTTRVGRTGPEPFRAIALIVPRPLLLRAADRYDPRAAQHLLHRDLGCLLGERAAETAAREVADHVRALVRELGRADTLLARPATREAAAQLLAELLVELLAREGLLEAERHANDPALARRVRTAEAFMRANLGDIASIGEVAEAAGLSLRLLQIAFRQVTGTPPSAALAAIRLDEARRRLTQAADGTSVSAVALDCGFMHFGRFARAYRARHGEAPSETLGRARR